MLNFAGQFQMQQPVVPLNCPPGLEYLTMVDQILIHQKVEMLEGVLEKLGTCGTLDSLTLTFHCSIYWF